MIRAAASLVPLNDVGEWISGGTPSKGDPAFWGGTIPWISAKSLKHLRLWDSEDRVTEVGAAEVKLVDPGTVIFAVRGMSLANEFRVGVAQRQLVFNQDLRAIIPSSHVDPYYLARFLRYAEPRILNLTDNAAHGTKRLPVPRLQEFKIPLPPLAEQKRIAGILDAADALRAKRREALAQLDTLLQATFLDMFGDPVTNPKGWKVRALAEGAAKTKVGPFGSLLHVADYIAGGVPLVNPKHMVNGRIVHGGDETVSEAKASELQEYRLKIGDVLVARRGEMGRCVIVQQEHSDWLCGTGSFYIRTHGNGMLPEFLAACISSQPMRKFLDHLSGGAIMPSLSGTQIKDLRIPIPPMAEQETFVRGCQSISNHLQQQSQHLADLDTLFASLQSRAFRGEL